MKKILLIALILGTSGLVLGQSPVRNAIAPAPGTSALTNKVSINDVNVPKTLACIDTLRYPQTKEQVLGTSAFYTFTLWTADAESMSQTYLLSGSTLSINGIEVYGRRNPSSTANLALRASIYNVDINNLPTTEVGFASITIADTLYSYRQINFSSALSVSSNYAVVLRPTSAGGIVQLYVNNIATGQIYDEGLSKAKSNYYTGSSGNWVSVPVLTSSPTQFPNGPYDFEMLVAAKVSYTINTNFATSPNPSCIGTPVNFGNSTTPVSVLSSRFYNYNQFRSYFQSIPDSTYAYDMTGAPPLVWGGSQTYTYSTAATHNPILYTLGGFWASCLDNKTNPVTVNPLPTVTASSTASTICGGDPVTLTGGGASTYVWNNGVTNGVAFTPTATTTYTVTGTDANNCSNTASTTVAVTTVNAATTTNNLTITADNATATYQWVDCNNGNQPIANETNQSYTATATGDYAVMVTENGCTQMSACVNVTFVGIEQSNTGNKITIYPNPASENFTLVSTYGFNGTVVKVIAITGQVLIETKIISGNKQSFNMNTFSPGLYFIEVNQNGEMNRMKVVKN